MFLYSRKLQILLLITWCIAMCAMYFYVTHNTPIWLEGIVDKQETQEVHLGVIPEIKNVITEIEQEPQGNTPAAHDTMNRCYDFRVEQVAGAGYDMINIHVDYVAAKNNGFSIDKIEDYYLSESPTYVLSLGKPWINDAKMTDHSIILPQLKNIKLILSKSDTLRLLIATTNNKFARNIKLKIDKTDTGFEAQLRIPH